MFIFHRYAYVCVSKFLPLKFRNNNGFAFAFAFAHVQLDAEQKLEQARIFKEKGTKHFKASFVKLPKTSF